jgi:YspA, cpYpsA-related SLOG family
MKVLVCGGRDFTDRMRLFEVLDHLHRESGFTLVIHCDASGADHEAEVWREAASRFPIVDSGRSGSPTAAPQAWLATRRDD